MILGMETSILVRNRPNALALLAISAFLLGLAACSKPSRNYTVPDTTMHITFPRGWVKMKQADFEKAMDEMKKRQDIPDDYKDAVEAIRKFNRYTFLRPRKTGNRHHNLNLTILTMKMEDVDFEQIARQQIAEMHNMTGFQSANMDDCPQPGLDDYRCYSTIVKVAERKRTEYHYITKDNGYFVEIGFGVSTPGDLTELSAIASSIHLESKPGPQSRQ